MMKKYNPNKLNNEVVIEMMEGNYRTFRPYTYFEKIIVLIEYIVYLFQKVIPRIFVCAIIPWMLKDGGLITTLKGETGEALFENGILTDDGAMVTFIILLFVVFIKFPPRVEKLYLIQKTNSLDEYRRIHQELDSLSKLCKNLYRLRYGIYSVGNSYLIIGKCKTEINRLYYDLKQRDNFDEHEKILTKVK